MLTETSRIAFIALPLLVLAALATPVPTAAAPAAAGPRGKEIRRLEQELAVLEGRLKEAMEFRARYRNLKADLTFQESLGREDDALLKKLLAYLNTPLSLFEAFLSKVASSWEKAERAKGRYTPEKINLWLRCRFGLPAIKERAYYTVRVDVVDSQKGARIYQSLGPFQRRVSQLIEKIPIPLTGIKVAPGSYQMRIFVEVGGSTVNTLIPFQMAQAGSAPARPTPSTRPTPLPRATPSSRPTPGPPRGGGDLNTIGDF